MCKGGHKADWDILQSQGLGSGRHKFPANDILNPDVHNSVTSTINALNSGKLHVDKGYCAVFSASGQEYYLLWRFDKEDEAHAAFNIVKASGVWDISQTVELGAEEVEQDSVKPFIDGAWHRDVGSAIDKLNSGKMHMQSGYCMVFSAAEQKWHLVWRSDKKDEAFAAFNIKKGLPDQSTAQQQYQISLGASSAGQSGDGEVELAEATCKSTIMWIESEPATPSGLTVVQNWKQFDASAEGDDTKRLVEHIPPHHQFVSTPLRRPLTTIAPMATTPMVDACEARAVAIESSQQPRRRNSEHQSVPQPARRQLSTIAPIATSPMLDCWEPRAAAMGSAQPLRPISGCVQVATTQPYQVGVLVQVLPTVNTCIVEGIEQYSPDDQGTIIEIRAERLGIKWFRTGQTTVINKCDFTRLFKF